MAKQIAPVPNVLARALSHTPVLVSGDVFAGDASPIMTSPTAIRSEVDHAISRAQEVLLATQAPDGHWVGEAEANSTITSEYLLFCHLTDRVDRERERKMVSYLRRQQIPDGGWSLYDQGAANLSATVKAYFAMKVAGAPPDDE